MTTTHKEYIILGCGPAGLQATYHMKKHNMDFLTLEKTNIPGSFFAKYPRHRTLISINKKYSCFPEPEYNMRHDWNSLISDDPDLLFTKYTDKLFPHTDYLVQYMADFAEKLGLNEHIKFNTTVLKISKDKATDHFVLKTEGGHTYTCKALVMATGAMKEKMPKVPGVEHCGTYATHSLDLEDYKDKSVAIIGCGNSAFECGDHVAETAGFIQYIFRQPFCKLAWDTHFVGDLRAINNSTIDMYHLKSLVAFRSANPTGFSKADDGGVIIHMDMDMPHWSPPGALHMSARYDKVIIATGWNYIDPDMFDPEVMPETRLDGKFPVLDEMWQTSTKNLFYIGTTSQSRDRKAASGFIHGFRYTAGVMVDLLRHKFNKAELPKQVFSKFVLDDIASFMIKRYSTVSSLYQMNHGVLCDVMIFHDKRASSSPRAIRDSKEDLSMKEEPNIEVEYITQVPATWVKAQKHLMNNPLVWICSLGDSRGRYPANVNPTAFCKPPDLQEDNSSCSSFLEPRFEVFKNGKPQGMLFMGGQVIVRYDVPQMPGGKVDKFKNKIKNWINDQLNLGYPKFDTSIFNEEQWSNIYTIWTEEQLMENNEKRKLRTKPDILCPMGIIGMHE